MEKVLYFEGVGSPDAERSKATIGNCRLRTAFHLDNGKPVYLEIICKVGLNGIGKYEGLIDSLYYITGEKYNSDDAYMNRLLKDGNDARQTEMTEKYRKYSNCEWKSDAERERLHRQLFDYRYDFIENRVQCEYSKDGILAFLRGIGATFDDIIVDNDYDNGYKAFSWQSLEVVSYNYGDSYSPTDNKTA